MSSLGRACIVATAVFTGFTAAAHWRAADGLPVACGQAFSGGENVIVVRTRGGNVRPDPSWQLTTGNVCARRVGLTARQEYLPYDPYIISWSANSSAYYPPKP